MRDYICRVPNVSALLLPLVYIVLPWNIPIPYCGYWNRHVLCCHACCRVLRSVVGLVMEASSTPFCNSIFWHQLSLSVRMGRFDDDASSKSYDYTSRCVSRMILQVKSGFFFQCFSLSLLTIGSEQESGLYFSTQLNQPGWNFLIVDNTSITLLSFPSYFNFRYQLQGCMQTCCFKSVHVYQIINVSPLSKFYHTQPYPHSLSEPASMRTLAPPQSSLIARTPWEGGGGRPTTARRARIRRCRAARDARAESGARTRPRRPSRPSVAGTAHAAEPRGEPRGGSTCAGALPQQQRVRGRSRRLLTAAYRTPPHIPKGMSMKLREVEPIPSRSRSLILFDSAILQGCATIMNSIFRTKRDSRDFRG